MCDIFKVLNPGFDDPSSCTKVLNLVKGTGKASTYGHNESPTG